MKIADIQRTTAEVFGIGLIDLLSERQARRVAWPRQAAMLLCRDLTKQSLPAIGRRFNRHHTTVLYGIDEAQWRCRRNPWFAARVEAIRQQLTAGETDPSCNAGSRIDSRDSKN